MARPLSFTSKANFQTIDASHINSVQTGLEEVDAALAIVEYRVSVINAVVDYDADNTGTADTYAELNAAIAAAAAAKKLLYIPPGTYRTSDTLDLQNNSRIVGYGAVIQCYITSLGDSGTMAPVLESMDKSNVVIEGLEIDGRQSSWASSEWKPGINIEGSTNVRVLNVYSHDNKGDGISISTMTPNKHNNDVTVQNSQFDTNYRGGIFLGDGTNVRIINCTGRYNTGTSPMFGMDIEPDGDQSIVEDVLISGCTFSHNGVEDSDGAGFYITVRDKTTGFTATAGTTTTVTITGPVTANAYRNCILRWLTGNNAGEEQIITSHTTTVFTLAEATSSSTANTDTFEIIPRQRNIVVENCHIEYNGIHGNIFYHSRDVVFRNNWVQQNGSRGLEIRGRSENILVDGNTIVRNDGDCILFGSGSNRTLTNIRVVNNYLRGRLDGGDGIEIDTGDTVNYLTLDNNDIGDVAIGIKVVGTLTAGVIGRQQWGTTTTGKTSGLTQTNAPSKTMTKIIGGASISTGVQKGDMVMGCTGVITGVDALADQSGSIVVDIWKDTYANYPPVDADSITASAPVTITTATKSQDYTLTGWTKHFSAGDTFRFNVDSVTSHTCVAINIHYVEL